MSVTYSIKRDIISAKHCWLNAGRSLINGLSSFMAYLKEDWCVIVYAFVLMVISSKE